VRERSRHQAHCLRGEEECFAIIGGSSEEIGTPNLHPRFRGRKGEVEKGKSSFMSVLGERLDQGKNVHLPGEITRAGKEDLSESFSKKNYAEPEASPAGLKERSAGSGPVLLGYKISGGINARQESEGGEELNGKGLRKEIGRNCFLLQLNSGAVAKKSAHDTKGKAEGK